jgi:hypothetical protein
MKIIIETIPHNEQRYETVGDWYVSKDGAWNVKVSKMGNWKYELLVAVHELIEYALCKDRGITDAVVSKFDKQFERERAVGIHEQDEEPGDSPIAPYRKEHFFATNLERLLSAELGVKWFEYDKKVMSL